MFKKFSLYVFIALFFLSCFFYCGNSLLILIEDKQSSKLIFNSDSQIKVANTKRLPVKGKNFKTYSRFLSTLGRTHVHEILREAILESYQNLFHTDPKIVWIYGETGWKNGEHFWPHRTHRNGLSVDFITPVRNINDQSSTTLPLSIFNIFGYGIGFNSKGYYKNFYIDSKAIIQHLSSLKKSCEKRNLRIKRIIFDPPLQKILKSDLNYFLIQTIDFMKNQAWFPMILIIILISNLLKLISLQNKKFSMIDLSLLKA